MTHTLCLGLRVALIRRWPDARQIEGARIKQAQRGARPSSLRSRCQRTTNLAGSRVIVSRALSRETGGFRDSGYLSFVGLANALGCAALVEPDSTIWVSSAAAEVVSADVRDIAQALLPLFFAAKPMLNNGRQNHDNSLAGL